MKKSLLILGLLAVALPQLMASPEDAAILTAAESYLSENATVTTKIKFIVERVEGDLARVRINPQARPAKDTVWIFLQKKEGKWTGLTVRASFSEEDYQRFGIPKSLQVPY